MFLRAYYLKVQKFKGDEFRYIRISSPGFVLKSVSVIKFYSAISFFFFVF